jgi:diadenosine tetraphosphatase ApaH/serine/threonine PP2A family protein phosphatase
MRVAALYDIHGNLPALEAVLPEIRQAGVTHIVVGGDVLPGPLPRETLARLLDLEVPTQFLHGNGEVAVLAERAGTEAYRLPESAREVVRWTARQLDPELERWLASWPRTLRLDIPGLGGVLFCHATPRNENECFLRTTPEERLLPVFAGLDVALVVCGHTHMQFDRTVGGIRVVNAGSVGMPFGEPGADWLLLGSLGSLGSNIELRHTAYDLAKAAERIRGTEYPQAEEFAARNLLQPPSEREMLALFSPAELR